MPLKNLILHSLLFFSFTITFAQEQPNFPLFASEMRKAGYFTEKGEQLFATAYSGQLDPDFDALMQTTYSTNLRWQLGKEDLSLKNASDSARIEKLRQIPSDITKYEAVAVFVDFSIGLIIRQFNPNQKESSPIVHGASWKSFQEQFNTEEAWDSTLVRNTQEEIYSILRKANMIDDMMFEELPIIYPSSSYKLSITDWLKEILWRVYFVEHFDIYKKNTIDAIDKMVELKRINAQGKSALIAQIKKPKLPSFSDIMSHCNQQCSYINYDHFSDKIHNSDAYNEFYLKIGDCFSDLIPIEGANYFPANEQFPEHIEIMIDGDYYYQPVTNKSFQAINSYLIKKGSAKRLLNFASNDDGTASFAALFTFEELDSLVKHKPLNSFFQYRFDKLTTDTEHLTEAAIRKYHQVSAQIDFLKNDTNLDRILKYHQLYKFKTVNELCCFFYYDKLLDLNEIPLEEVNLDYMVGLVNSKLLPLGYPIEQHEEDEETITVSEHPKRIDYTYTYSFEIKGVKATWQMKEIDAKQQLKFHSNFPEAVNELLEQVESPYRLVEIGKYQMTYSVMTLEQMEQMKTVFGEDLTFRQ